MISGNIMLLEDKDGYPRTASIGWGWIVCAVAVTSGTAFLALALYLAIWIYLKTRALAPILCIAASLASGVVTVALDRFDPASVESELFSTASAVLLIFFAFLLRRSVIRYYREAFDWDIIIGPWFTLFFSVIYINYCLNPQLSLALSGPPLTSLNIPSSGLKPVDTTQVK